MANISILQDIEFFSAKSRAFFYKRLLDGSTAIVMHENYIWNTERNPLVIQL